MNKYLVALCLLMTLSVSKAAPVYACKVDGEVATIELRDGGKIINSWSVDTWILTALKLC